MSCETQLITLVTQLSRTYFMLMYVDEIRLANLETSLTLNRNSIPEAMRGVYQSGQVFVNQNERD